MAPEKNIRCDDHSSSAILVAIAISQTAIFLSTLDTTHEVTASLSESGLSRRLQLLPSALILLLRIRC